MESMKSREQVRLLVGGDLLDSNRAPTNIEFGSDLQDTSSNSLDFLGAEPRNDLAPLADSGRTDIQRPRDIRSQLKVINNVLLEHARSLTTVQSLLQPQSKTSVLTSVDMETLAERLQDAMGDEITASDLARACKVSPAAVSKWLDGRTKALKADKLAAAARALHVRDEWLRTGRLPREREGAVEDRQVDRVIAILAGLRQPLSELTAAIESLSQAGAEPKKRAKS